MTSETPDESGSQITRSEASSTGLDENLAGLLTYVLGFATGIVFLILEKKSSYVRFHAMQSTITFLSLFVVSVVAGRIPLFGGIVALLLPLASVVVWILLMVKAFQGERYKLPYVGDLAEERAQLR